MSSHISTTITRAASIDEAAHALSGLDLQVDVPLAHRLTDPEEVRAAFEKNNRRPGWVWLARREGRVVAALAAWAGSDADLPVALDLPWLGTEPDRVQLFAELLATAYAELREQGLPRVELNLVLPPDRTTMPPPFLPDMHDALATAGFRHLVGRRRFRADDPARVPETTDRLRFEPVESHRDPVLVDAYRRTLVDSVDAHTVEAARSQSLDEITHEDLRDMELFIRPVSLWRVAYDRTDGALVGLVTGGAGERALNGYVGVVPEKRGHGFAADLLAFMTRQQFAAGARSIAGETDDDNVAMGITFERGGYVQESARVDFVR
ncbi:hypothetical protein CLV46_1745 [Diaminobutyricimonas aerilata]|uniref:N-acetyltransferase domain-containing protein n=1 Tax=Diaminobutyricimonas aerilata TaxID=1162967 RepID=A0A2M9CJX5_9MICO|nr:hypothetical protein [Diaminobutyricimonas aerilata]PJJ72180.1 hypothetical protein CLV46_1745 [Diaminobutyricimonas aerilata]